MKIVNVKYFAETEFPKEPQKATEGSIGLFNWTFVGLFQKVFVVKSFLVPLSLETKVLQLKQG